MDQVDEVKSFQKSNDLRSLTSKDINIAVRIIIILFIDAIVTLVIMFLSSIVERTAPLFGVTGDNLLYEILSISKYTYLILYIFFIHNYYHCRP